MANEVVSFQSVDFSYNGASVLENVDFSIPDNAFISIVGPNGGGKTTLLRLVLGLINPTRGTIKVFGLPPEKARTLVGYMPQHLQFDSHFPVTVLDVVLMGRLGNGIRFGFYRRKDKAICLEALKKLEMYDARNQSFGSLSGGQRQRVLVARALAVEPQMLLLDEPTSNVDIAGETELFELLHDISQAITVVVVSHDIGFCITLRGERCLCQSSGGCTSNNSHYRRGDQQPVWDARKNGPT